MKNKMKKYFVVLVATIFLVGGFFMFAGNAFAFEVGDPTPICATGVLSGNQCVSIPPVPTVCPNDGSIPDGYGMCNDDTQSVCPTDEYSLLEDSQTQCEIVYAPPTCPSGYTLNGSQCVANDTTSPVITGTFYRQGPMDGYATVGNIVQVSFETSEPISIDSMSIAGHAIGSYQPQNPDGTHFYITYTMLSSDIEGPLNYSLTGHDTAGNSTTVTGGGVTFDKTAPTATSVDSDGQTFDLTTPSPSTIKITFSENISNTPTVEVHSVVVGESVNSCSDDDVRTFCFDYTIPSPQVATHTIWIYGAQDIAGNTMTMDQIHTFNVNIPAPIEDTTAPTVTFVAPTPENGTRATNNDQTFKVSLSENVSSCKLIASNGDFENGLSGWIVGGNVGLMTNDYHSTNHSLLLQTTNDNGGSYNYAYTNANLPSGGLINLNAWIKRTTTDGIRWDQQRIYLTDSSGNFLVDLLYDLSNTGWTNVNYDISGYAGQSVRAYFAVSDDGAGDPSRMWVDDVVITGGLQGGEHPMEINGLEATLNWSNMQDGNYNYYVECSDLVGNNGVSTNRILTVDTTAPAVTLNGNDPMYLIVGDTFTDPGATAVDAVDGVITVTPTGEVDANTVGTYTITYTATDATLHTATKTRTVYVNLASDETAPIISSIYATASSTIEVTFNEELQNNGSHSPAVSDFRVYNGTEYNGENGYQIASVSYSNPTTTIILTDPIRSGDNPHLDIVDLRTTIIDLSGNYFSTGSQYDHKVYDEMAPVITLNGDATVNLTVGDAYTDVGATCTDIVDVTCEVITTGTVDTAAVGAYTITYNASDEAGNDANQVTRTINVVARQSSGGGGGGGGGEGVITGLLGVVNHAPMVPAPITGRVLGASTFVFNMNLRFGMLNNDVRELQIRLTGEGVYTGPITGYFGSLTLKAVKAYQVKKGLPQTGFVGPMTRAVLNGTESADPLSEREATMESIRQQIQNLMAQLAELQAQLGTQ